MSAKLTPKQQRFIREYLIDHNGTQAAIRAGYSPKTANEQSSQLLAKLNVKAAIKEATEKVAAKLEITHERIIAELAAIGFSDIRDHVDYGPQGVTLREGKTDSRCVSEVSQKPLGFGKGAQIRLKLHDKIQALNIMANRLYGLPVQKLEHGGKIDLGLVVLPAIEEEAQSDASSK